MDVMYVRHRVGGPPRLLSGETLLHEQDSGKLRVKRVLGLLSGETPLDEQDHLRAMSIYCSPFCQGLLSPAQLHSFGLLSGEPQVCFLPVEREIGHGAP